MLTRRKLTVYLLTFVSIGLLSGLALYTIYDLAMQDSLYILSLLAAMAYSFGFLFVTYVVYLLAYPKKGKTSRFGVFEWGVFCFAVEVLVGVASAKLLTGFETSSVILNVVTVGAGSFVIPYFNDLFDKMTA
jgi:hypothetical protein